jgi:hypothetical protein
MTTKRRARVPDQGSAGEKKPSRGSIRPDSAEGKPAGPSAWLREHMHKYGPLRPAEIHREAAKAGFSLRQMREAANTIGIARCRGLWFIPSANNRLVLDLALELEAAGKILRNMARLVREQHQDEG